ncbi:hypothetical protein [Lysobacter sp. CA196]|uniref:hypothetical protein n=1 Tax=Lysobacter sp. CA196 TaxID=3455606 RepID=UPI003F8D0B7F
MVAKKSNTTGGLLWHPSLKKVFKGCDQWWQHSMVDSNVLEGRFATLHVELQAPGVFVPALATLHMIGHAYATRACTTETAHNPKLLVEALQYAMQFRALDFRKVAGLSLPHEHQPLRPFLTGMQSAGPAMLSQWALAEVCAKILIDVAEKDLRMKPLSHYPDGWRRGTSDAFLIYLFSAAFDLETSYRPKDSVCPEYQAVLDSWRTDDEAVFCKVMQAASDFHISRSRGSTNRIDYEFEYNFDRVYPAELLAVQALRRRVGAPEFAVGHLLVDTPWSLIRDLPEMAPHPLAVQAEARLRQDYPSFR